MFDPLFNSRIRTEYTYVKSSSRGCITHHSTRCNSNVISIFHKHAAETAGNEDASGNEIARKIRIKRARAGVPRGYVKSRQYHAFEIFECTRIRGTSIKTLHRFSISMKFGCKGGIIPPAVGEVEKVGVGSNFSRIARNLAVIVGF